MPDVIDLTNCDREPIHIPGSIQPHGALLACDASVTIVQRHSANAAEMLGLAGPLNDTPIAALLSQRAVHDIRNAATTSGDATRPSLLLAVDLGTGVIADVAVHRINGTVILEFEPAHEGESPLHRARDLISRIIEIRDLDTLLRRGTRLVQALAGYDRVMVYRFTPDGAGKVVSEVKRSDLESFLGQYFPAGDIPAQARELYLRNTIRVIADAGYTRVPIIPELDDNGRPLDLSLSHLRSVSPVHCEYLHNMGVAASMSISIIVDGALWGLIACHHYSPRAVPMTQRLAAELFGQFFSLHLHALRQRESLETATAARRALDRFLRLASHETDVGRLLADSLADFAQLIPCNGIGLAFGSDWTTNGSVPPSEAVPDLLRVIGEAAQARVWATDSLVRYIPEAADYAREAAGVLAIPLSQAPRDWLLFFRQELVQTLEWAGNPDKRYRSGPLGDRLTPRESFALWKETVRQRAEPWSEADRETAEAIRAATVEVVLRHTELMAEERGKADLRQRMLNEELNHRVKNILAVIKSLIGHPVGEGRDLDAYVSTLRGRIQALAFAHDQVVRGDGGGLLAELASAELGPYGDQGAEVTIAGPGIWLDSRAFSVMALILHELATNAAKYGALSRAGGSLSVTWRSEGGGTLLVEWLERGGPPVLPPTRSGFGTALIERSVPFDLGGEATIDYQPEGLLAKFRLPAAHVALTGEAPTPLTVPQPAPRTPLPEGLTIMVLEDQMLIAMDAEAMLLDAGAAGVLTATGVHEAQAILMEAKPDAAVLDVNLGQGTSIPVATELARRRIPFVFATGYGESAHIPEALRHVPVVRKPYDGRALASAVAEIVKERPGD